MIRERADLSKLYEVIAATHYNSERLDVLQEVLKKILVKRDSKVDLVAEARSVFNSKQEEWKHERMPPLEGDGVPAPTWFKQETLLLSNVPIEHVPEYILKKYLPFSAEFEGKYGLDAEALLDFSLGVFAFIGFKKQSSMFIDETYQFKTKEEYADLGFVARPSAAYIDAWRNIATFSISELERTLSGTLAHQDVRKALEILSIDWRSVLKDTEVSFAFTPFLRIDEDTAVLMTDQYLVRSLPVIYELLFKELKGYRDRKGKTYEALVQDTLKSLPFSGLTFNVRYGGRYEVDAICEFPRSIWFVEVTSHPPSSEALKGDLASIEEDLDKALRKCRGQGMRCVSHLGERALLHWGSQNKTKGILVIVDGVYPQLNMDTFIKFSETEAKIYVINWFDLRTLLEQPEKAGFEDFLLWRTMRPMPVLSFDEKDYWGFYFDRYAGDERMRQAYELAKQKNIKVTYISPRFTDKAYLGKIASPSRQS